MMTSGDPMSSMIKSKQKALVLISMMILAQATILIPSVTADISPNSTLITTFSNDDTYVTIQFDSSGEPIQPGASLEIPRNTTVEALNFGFTYNSSNSPGNFWLDMNEDGIINVLDVMQIINLILMFLYLLL